MEVQCNWNDCPAQIKKIRLNVQKYDLHVSYIPRKFMHAADALSRAAMADDIRNACQTEFDVEAQVVAVIKYVPITDKKWTKKNKSQ